MQHLIIRLVAGRHRLVDGHQQAPTGREIVAAVVYVEGCAVVECRGHILIIASGHAAVTVRCGTVDARGDATVIAVGPVQVFARDRAVICCRRDAVGAPIVRCQPSVTVRGDFDSVFPLA